ncbi:MAG: 5,6-dimethylbenzimidazole synthase [Bermanella sp.]
MENNSAKRKVIEKKLEDNNRLIQDVEFSQDDKDGLYKSIFNRRDVRGQFKPDPIPNDVLARILQAAHHAPSVGFMQPWNFLVIQSPQIKEQIHNAFVSANEEAANMFEDEQQKTYRALKLEGIREAPINICITCDREKAGPVVIGRTHMSDMDIYSSVCAVQNLWLAARAEGVGMGWVSIMEESAFHEILGIPKKVIPVAYLCLGYVSHFNKEPELETANWRKRLPLTEQIYFDQWQQSRSSEHDTLMQELEKHRDFPLQYK